MDWHNLIFTIYQVIVIGTVIHVILDNRQPVKTIAWALVILFVPVIGFIFYLFFGVNTRRERLVSRRSLDQLSKRSMLGFVKQTDLQIPEGLKPTIDLFVNESFSLPFNNNKVELLTNGYDFFLSLLRDMARARSHIHIDVYIFEDDALGRLVSDMLIAKAREGVEVRIIYDDVGCWSVKNRFFEQMRESGIEVEAFLPVRFPSFTRKANYRNHRKLFIVDGMVGYIGGMNIAERYVKGIRNRAMQKGNDGMLPWRDTMARIEGVGVYSLQRAFLIDWYFVDRTLLSDRKYYPQQTPEDSSLKDSSQSSFPLGLSIQTSLPLGGLGRASTSLSTLIQTVTSNPTSPYPELLQGYVRLISTARQYIYIETPYFLPTDVVFFALKTAAIAGADVRLLVPRYCDARFIEWASRSFLREAEESGIHVSLYESGFLHSKLMVIDDIVCTCGSTNFDFRSLENNFEANSFFYGADVAVRMREVFLDDLKQSTALSTMPDRMHPKFHVRLYEGFARLFSPLL